MKRKITVIVLIFCLLFSSCTYLFLLLEGKNLIINKLKNLTEKNVTLGSINYIPPFKFQIKELSIQGLLKADTAFISSDILGLFSGKFAFNEIKLINPEISYERQISAKPGSVEIPLRPSSSKANTPKAFSRRNNSDFLFRRIIISNGKINLFDHTAGEKGLKITVKDVFLDLTNIHKLPFSIISNFDFKGNIPWAEGQNEGVITAHGWVDLFKKDINAVLKIEGIDGVYLYPYYADWIDIHKARIEKAKLNFLSNIYGLDNDVSAQCHLELNDIVFKPRPPEEQQDQEEKIMRVVLNMFKAMGQEKVVVDFTFKTKMDRPEFGFQIIKGALETKIANSKKNNRPLAENIIMFPATILEGAVRSATDISKAVIEGSFAVGNEFKKAIQTSFRK